MPDLVELFLLFLRLGLLAVGGGVSILSEAEREVVAHGWMDHASFVQAFALSQITPGPQMLYVAVVGYYAMGIAGAITASVAFFLPPALLALAVAATWDRLSRSPWPDAVRRSLGPVAVGLSAAGAYTLAPAALTSDFTWTIFGLAFAVLLFVPRVSPGWLVFAGAGAGLLARVAGVG